MELPEEMAAAAEEAEPVIAGPAGSSLEAKLEPNLESTDSADDRWVPWWGGVIALVVGGVLSQLLGSIPIVIGVFVWISNHGVPEGVEVQQMMQELTHDFRFLGPSILVTGATMAGVAFLTVKIARVPIRRGLGLKGAPWPAFLAAPIGILALGPTSDFLHRMMVEYLPWATLGALEGLDGLARSAPIYLILPAMALSPGFAEELLFRGAFQRSIRNGALAVFLSGLLFSCYHMDPQHVVAVLPLGFYLAWLGQRTGSLAVPITGHVFNNAAAVLASVYLASEVAEEVLDWWWMPIGWAVCGACVGAVWFSTRKVSD